MSNQSVGRSYDMMNFLRSKTKMESVRKFISDSLLHNHLPLMLFIAFCLASDKIKLNFPIAEFHKSDGDLDSI